MSSSIGQNPPFYCQQLVMKYRNGWLKFDWNSNTVNLQSPQIKNKQMIRNDNIILGYHLVLVTLYQCLQLLLSKTIRIGDTKYHI